MVTNRRSWGKCNSDNRFNHKPHMNGVTLYPFPKPSRDPERCKAWTKAYGRPLEQLNENKIGRYHFVCSKVCFLMLNFAI